MQYLIPQPLMSTVSKDLSGEGWPQRSSAYEREEGKLERIGRSGYIPTQWKSSSKRIRNEVQPSELSQTCMPGDGLCPQTASVSPVQ